MVKTVSARCEVDKAGHPQIIIATSAVDSEQDRAQLGKMRVRIPLRVTVNHDYRELPVGQVDRRDQIAQDDHRIVAQFRWLEGDARADRVKNAYTQGMLDGSIGVRVEGSEPNAFGGIDYWGEIIEFALTPIPANSECQALVRSLFGMGGVVRPRVFAPDDTVVSILVDDPAPPGRPWRSWTARGVTGCPAATDCPNEDQRELCPAGKLCPMSGPARTSWGGEPVLRLVDLAPSTRVRFSPEDFEAAWRQATTEIAQETYRKLKGRVD